MNDRNKAVFGASSLNTIGEDAEFEENRVYAIDTVNSTSDGKCWIRSKPPSTKGCRKGLSHKDIIINPFHTKNKN